MQTLKAAGFSVETHEVQDLDAIASRHNVPDSVRSCHTAVVGGYTVEGHVPAAVIKHLLKARPKLAGIGVAGMPPGSPGMESRSPVPYDVIGWRASGETFVYAEVGADGSVQYPK